MEEGCPDTLPDEEDDTFEFKVKCSVCNVVIGNNDLGVIVNGFPGDPIHLRPFDKCFTQANIWGWWVKVGLMLMTRNCLNDSKVRYQLGEGRAPTEAGSRIPCLVVDYEQVCVNLTVLGFNSDVLDLEVDEAVENAPVLNEEEVIEKLVKEKTVCSVGGLFRAG